MTTRIVQMTAARFQSLTRGDRVALAFVVALALLAGAWSLSSLWLPFGWDHGVFGLVSDVIRRGGVPYRDIWEIKGPAALYVYAAVDALFGARMWGVRLLDLALLGASGVAGWGLVERFAGRAAATLGVASLVLGFAGFGNWYTAQPDGWAAQLLVVIVAALATPVPSERRLAAAGALLGVLFLVKPTYIFYSLLFVPALVPVARAGVRPAARSVGMTVLAFAVPVCLLVAYFAWTGALAPFIDQHVRFNQERIATDPSLRMSLPRIVVLATSIITATPELAAAFPAAALGVAVVARRQPRLALTWVLWLVMALATIAFQRKFLPHNYSWHPVYPPLLLAAAIGFGRLWFTTEARLELRSLAAALALLMAYQLAKLPAAQTGRWLAWVLSPRSLEDYRASFEGPLPWLSNKTALDAFGFSVTRDVRFAKYVREHTAPQDRVFVWGDPLVNHLSARPPATPITAPEAFTIWGSPERRARYRAEFASALRAGHASLVAIPTFALAPSEDPEFSIPSGFPELAVALGEAYEQHGVFEDLVLYRPRAKPLR